MFQTSTLLSTASSAAHGFFGMEGGVSVGAHRSLNCGYGDDNVANVDENRRRVVAKLPGVEALITLKQVHGGEVVYAGQPWSLADTPKADGFVTDKAGLALGILTADCAPLLFVDPTNNIIGACHAGWRGAVGCVIENTIEKMVSIGAKRDYILASIGPTIHSDSYEVDDAFVKEASIHTHFSNDLLKKSTKPGHHHFNLSGFCEKILKTMGICGVEALRHNTYAGPFFSRRRAVRDHRGVYGSNLSLISLVR